MNVQLVIGIIFLAGALFFLGRRAYRSMAGKGSHGSCADCSPDGQIRPLADSPVENTKQEKKPD